MEGREGKESAPPDLNPGDATASIVHCRLGYCNAVLTGTIFCLRSALYNKERSPNGVVEHVISDLLHCLELLYVTYSCACGICGSRSC